MLKKEKDWLAKIGEWRLNHISERNFILLLGLLVGVVSGCAAVLLKNMIYYFGRFIINFFAADTENFLFLFLPLIGVALSFVYVKYVVKDDISHGVSRVLYAISK
ncbi:MAG: chloride channel protein, partial [Bacteroidales bacterium]